MNAAFDTDLIAPESVQSMLVLRRGSLASGCAALGIDDKARIVATQVHGADHVLIDKSNAIEDLHCDALITQDPNYVICVKSADCLPILIYHPSGTVAAIHAGRKGTKLGILARTLDALTRLTTSTQDYEIWFGPHICEDCYQIDRERDLHYSLLNENTAQLKSSGLGHALKVHSPMCTSCHVERYFSYRKGDLDRRLYSAISLR